MFLYGESRFELDFLIITPYGVVILEVKNIIGELEFMNNPSQLIQLKEDGKITKYPCPANQLNEYKYQLSQFFLQHNISIPIHGVVIFVSRNSFVKQSVNDVRIIYKNELRSYLRSLADQNSSLSKDEMNNIKEVLLRKTTSSPAIPLIDYFSIPYEELKQGVKCESCSYIGMQKKVRTWFCPSCKNTNSNAHLKAISTYFLLCKHTIPIKNAEIFLF